MARTEREGRPAKLSPRNLWLALALYLCLGAFGALLAAWFVVSLTSEISAGCRAGGLSGLVCDHGPGEFVPPLLAGLAGYTMLSTVSRLRQRPPRPGPVVRAAAVLGVLVTSLPVLFVVAGTGETGEFNVFGSKLPLIPLLLLLGLPLLWALVSARLVWPLGQPVSPGSDAPHTAGAGAIPAPNAGTADRLPRRRVSRRGAALAGGLLLLLLGAGTVSGLLSKPPFRETPGTLTLRIEEPFTLVRSGSGNCAIGSGNDMAVSANLGGLRVFFSTSEMLGGRWSPELEPRRADDWEFVIGNLDRNPYASLRESEMGSTGASLLEGRWDSTGGSLRFARLSAFHLGSGASQPLNPDLAGTVEWTCQP